MENTSKVAHQKRNQHIALHPGVKSQSICRALDFGTKFVRRKMKDKNFEEINIKIVISM